MRKLFAPSFSADEVERYLPRIQEMSQMYCQKWSQAGAISHWEDQIKLFTFEIICAVVAGIDWR
jgi:cytochrome P450